MKNIFRIAPLILSQYLLAPALAQQQSLDLDLYATRSHLLPYKGIQNEVSATAYWNYSDSILPFIKTVYSQYDYTQESTASAVSNTINDSRTSAGIGIDLKIINSIKLRYSADYIKNKVSTKSYTQESFGVIYNQYISYADLDLNNYAESFYIPAINKNQLDSFFRFQALKNYYFSQTKTDSNSVYPFLQIKGKINDDNQFGISGTNGSLGIGFKYYNQLNSDSSIAVLAEAHTLIFQTKNLNSDWNQAFLAIQYLYK